MLPAFTQAMSPIVETPPAILPYTPLLLKFGNLDRRLPRRDGEHGDGNGEIGFLDFWCTLDQATPDVYVELWIFGGRLMLQVGYNEIFHGKGVLSGFGSW